MESDTFIHEELDTVLLKVASRCNINCAYCYVYNMGDDNWTKMQKFMSNETIDSICKSLYTIVKSQKRYFSVVLHGGEPLLLGLSGLELLFSKLREVLPIQYPISIQTNGVLINNSILDICSSYRVSISVSIDGPQSIHDKNRVNHSGRGTFHAVMKGIQLLKSHPDSVFLFAGLLSVIDPLSSPSEVYRFFKMLSPPSVDFLYKDGNHTTLPINKKSFESTEYGLWMVSLLNEYLNDSNPIKIRILDDMMKVILGGVGTKEGMGITDFNIVIIDTDGTIMKNDTLKSTFNGADKFITQKTINECNLWDFIQSSEFIEYKNSQKPTHSQCLNCPEVNVCGAGMILHRWSENNAFNNPSIYCNDQLLLIGNIRKKIAQLVLQDE